MHEQTDQRDATLPVSATLTALEKKQAILAHLVRMVARKISNGLFVAGQGGLGKSMVISKTLGQENVGVILLNSHITPLGLYRAMFENKNGQVWLVPINLQHLGIDRRSEDGVNSWP